MIELQHLQKAYSNSMPLKDVCTTIRKGDVIAVIGASGCGKSTLLRCINMLDPPIGGNEEATRISGVRVDRVKQLVYTLCGLMAAIAGIATAARLGVGQSTAGVGYEMDVIAAVIIGGASVAGGSGTVLGVIIGAAIMGVLNNGLVLLNVSAYWQQAVLGVVIIAAVSFDKLQSKRKLSKQSV